MTWLLLKGGQTRGISLESCLGVVNQKEPPPPPPSLKFLDTILGMHRVIIFFAREGTNNALAIISARNIAITKKKCLEAIGFA